MEEMQFNEPRQMPVLAIRGISVFPGTMLTFDVERPASKAALHAAKGRTRFCSSRHRRTRLWTSRRQRICMKSVRFAG